MKTIALFDVDGVINVFPNSKNVHLRRSGWSAEAWENETHHVTDVEYAGDYHILWNGQAVSAINELVAKGVDVGWLTTWTHDINGNTSDGLHSPTSTFSDYVTENLDFLTTTMGFESFPVLESGGSFGVNYSSVNPWWKCRAVTWLIDNTDYERIVWFDDDLFASTGKKYLSSYAKSAGVVFRGVTIPSSMGIGPNDLKLVTS